MSDVPVCVICLDEINDNQRALPCAHVFHAACVGEWTKKSKSCPICRQLVAYSFLGAKACSLQSGIAKARLRRPATRHCRKPRMPRTNRGYKRKRRIHTSK